MITLIKLGGSLITDKNIARYFRHSDMQRIATEIKTVISHPTFEDNLIIGHGSGSFGHIEAKKYNTINGVSSYDDWLGFTKVANAASELSQLVATELVKADLPIMRYQPSASILAKNGVVESMNTELLMTGIEHSLIPLIHGDVAFDEALGGTIVSTEAIFTFIVQQLPVNRIILLGEVNGVLDNDSKVVSQITPQSIESLKPALGGSGGVDVTGGMYQKVVDMLDLVQTKSNLEIIIANGQIPDVLVHLICDNAKIGTRISR